MNSFWLIAQSKASGIYFALPTQVTSNRIHLHFQVFLDAILAGTHQDGRALLIHANSWLVDPLPQPTPAPTSGRINADADALAGVDWFASRKRALLANFGVGTVAQALQAIVATRHFFVRQFGLAGKVVSVPHVRGDEPPLAADIKASLLRSRELRSTLSLIASESSRIISVSR